LCVKNPKTIGELHELIPSSKYWKNADKMKVMDEIARAKPSKLTALRPPSFDLDYSDSDSDDSGYMVVTNKRNEMKNVVEKECDLQSPPSINEKENCVDKIENVVVENESYDDNIRTVTINDDDMIVIEAKVNEIVDEIVKNDNIMDVDTHSDCIGKIEMVKTCKNIPTMYDRVDSSTVDNISNDELLANWHIIRKSKIPKYLQNHLRRRHKKLRHEWIHQERERKGMPKIDFRRRGKVQKPKQRIAQNHHSFNFRRLQ